MTCPECEVAEMDEDSAGNLSCMFCGFDEEACEGGCSI